MESKDELLKKLSEIYSKLSKKLDKSSINLCCPCNCCCTSILDHGISQIEYDYIEINLKESISIKNFTSYIRKKRNLKGNIIYTKCPFYDNKKYGCSIYMIRPYSCRIFGHYGRLPVPLFCSFRYSTIIHNVEKFYDIVPMAAEFFELKSMYDILITENPIEKAEKYYNLALYKCYRNDYKKAEIHLNSVIELNNGHSLAYYQLGTIYYNFKNQEKAIQNLRNALIYEPGNHKIRVNLGLFLIKYEKYEEAKEEFLAVLKDEPHNSFAISALKSIASYIS